MNQHVQSSTFLTALHDYIQNLPKKKTHKLSILSRCAGNPVTPESVQESICQAETRNAQKPSMKIMRRILNPLVTVLKDYYGIIDSLAQADPMPTAVIWGSLKIVIDGLGRFVDLFDKIKNELRDLTRQLQRLKFYEDLYDHPTMQECLFRSYKNVFRFWSRVDKECDRCSINAMLRAATSFSTKKLQNIVGDLKEDADEIQKLASILEASAAREERVDAKEERNEASRERMLHEQERLDALTWRNQQRSDRIRDWLGKSINEGNSRRHDNLRVVGSEIQLRWLTENPIFQEWTEGVSLTPILWAHAGPGIGKSVLCSQLVVHLRKDEQNPALAFQYYDFDDSQRSALSTARILAAQIFESFWLRFNDVPDGLNLQTQKDAANLDNVLEFIRLLVRALPKIYIFLDGLDEESNQVRWIEASKIIDFVIELATTCPETVRLWCSSQDMNRTRQKLGTFPSLNLGCQVKSAVNYYLTQSVKHLDDMGLNESTLTWILSELKSRANGNFLMANCMIRMLQNENGVACLDDVVDHVKSGLPKDIDDYFRRMFARYEAAQRVHASKIFALITFAKRPLRLRELQEAISIVSTAKPETLEAGQIVRERYIRKLFPPLIETREDPEYPDNPFCHLFHSTVKDYLIKYPEILQDESGPVRSSNSMISSSTIANACLMYLSQKRYSTLLSKNKIGDEMGEDRWLTSSGEDITTHHFLTYSAKYWDKHLDQVVDQDQHFSEKIPIFLASSNFQTTIQVESICVEGHFSIVTLPDNRSRLRKLWLMSSPWFNSFDPIAKSRFAKGYRDFLIEWAYFLDCGTCQDEKCPILPYSGEVDRFLWGALGPRNFLSSNYERHKSFMLSADEIDGEFGPYYEATSSGGDQVKTIRALRSSNSTDQDTTCFKLMTWYLRKRTAPILIRTEMIPTNHASTNWSAYCNEEDVQGQRIGCSKAISFSPELDYIRIGCQILSNDNKGSFIAIAGLESTDKNFMSYSEDMTARGPYVAVARRRRSSGMGLKKKYQKEDTNKGPDYGGNITSKITTSKVPISRVKHLDNSHINPPTDSPIDDEDYAEDENSDEFYPSSSEEDSQPYSADESWSEGSTALDQANQEFWSSSASSDGKASDTNESDEMDDGSKGETDDGESEGSFRNVILSKKQLLDESDVEAGEIRFDSDDEASFMPPNFSSDDDEADMYRHAAPLSRRRQKDSLAKQASIKIFDLSQGSPILLFKFTRILTLSLYDSPPAIHPTKSLAVWPLCGGDILFVDFKNQTFFIRGTLPSTRKTRHVFMKCHFSACGQYLHLLSLEAQRKWLMKRKKKSAEKEPLILSAFISTHRLSTTKTARSPPILIHSVKVLLGETTSLSISKMPVVLTWTPVDVYLSRSGEGNQLDLHRVRLFRHVGLEKAETNLVSVPRLPLFLPNSAKTRDVRYFPPLANATHATIIIGSEKSNINQEASPAASNDAEPSRDNFDPPIGLYLDENIDFGGWVPSSAMATTTYKLGNGQLRRKIELFNHDDDCDLDNYFFT